MYGVIDGLYYNTHDTTDELNHRLAKRTIPSSQLQPQFSSRPVSTKYSLMPIVDRYAPSAVPIIKHPTYNVENVFNPGNTMSPWSGFSANVNNESLLRNQLFALQTSAQAVYIPSSNSDMYKVNVGGRNEVQPFPDLFKEEKFEPFNPNTLPIGSYVFNNSTREQVLRSKLS
jgi:hypothetical protein